MFFQSEKVRKDTVWGAGIASTDGGQATLAWTDYATLAIADVTLKSLISPEAQKKGIIKDWGSQEKALDQ